MTEPTLDPDAYWHSPTRAWAPLMWIIGGVAFALSAMLLAPLVPLVPLAASALAAAPVTAIAKANAPAALR